MSDISANRLAEARKAKGLTQQQLADRLGVHFVTISKLERGKMQLTADWITKLASALEVHVGDIFSPPMVRSRIIIDGVVYNGFSIRPVTGIESRYIIETEDAYGDSSYSIAVPDDALNPFFHRGDVLRFTHYSDDGYAHSDGRVACLKLRDGRFLLAVIEAYKGDAKFDVRTLTGQRMSDVDVEIFSILSGAEVRALSKD